MANSNQRESTFMDLDSLFFLVGIGLLIVPVLMIWLAFSHVSLRRKVDLLDKQVSKLKSGELIPKTFTPAASDTVEARAEPPATRQMPLPEQAPPAHLADTTPKAEIAAKEADPSPTRNETPTAPALTGTILDNPPKLIVFDPDNINRLVGWVKENWFIAIAALSLAMAGIFLVQYGIENGVLSPRNRVLCALLFGGALIAGGEWIRRRAGDESGTTAFLPSAFAGAGVVTLFSAVLSAQQMYGLIGKETAFIALIGLAVLSLVLGWLYGTFLTVIGLIGAVSAPFIVSDGTSENITWLFYYFALIAMVGLGVDAMKRSAWVSSLAMIIPYIGASLLFIASGSEHFVAFAALVAIAAVCIPTVQLRPSFEGAMSSGLLTSFGKGNWPEFPTRLAAGGIISLALVAVLTSVNGAAGFWLALGILTIALVMIGYWFNRTAVLDDLAIPIALAMLAIIAFQGLLDLDVVRAFAAPLNADLGETAPRTTTWLVALGLAISALAGWRSLTDTRLSVFWAAGAAMFAPATVVLLSLYWQPLTHMSPAQWAGHVIGVAIMMTVFAEQTLRSSRNTQDGSGNLRTSLFALAALNMIAFAMSIVLTETALTLGFAGVAASAAWLDRKFNIRPVSWFVQLGVIACSYRLVADPGLLWALDATLLDMTIGFLGTIALIAVAWVLLRERDRTGALIVAESAIWSLGGIFVCLLLFRAMDDNDLFTHWAASLFGMVWLISATVQFYRLKIGGFFGIVRMTLGAIFGTLGLLLLGIAMTGLNPLYEARVIGPPIFDSLLVAYLLPAVLLGFVAWRFDHLSRRMRLGIGAVAGLSATMYVGLEIRRLWHGNDLTAYGVMENELYSYTVAMLVAGTVALGLALVRKSPTLRRASVTIISLTIAKVFLIDMSGLEGLTRVLSFLALGLVLAGLALLNRWVSKALEEE